MFLLDAKARFGGFGSSSDKRRMRTKAMRRILLSVILCLLVAAAHAHSDVGMTKPENGAVLEEMPRYIVLTFAKRIRLTRVWMTHLDNPRVDLDLGGQTEFLKKFEVPVPDKGAGLYRIEWRGLSIDGHAMSGDLSFQVK